MRFILIFVLIFKFTLISIKAQCIIGPLDIPETKNLIPYSTIIDIGHSHIPFQKVLTDFPKLYPRGFTGKYGNLGFTDHTYWVRFQIQNKLSRSVHYFLEAAEPMTDNLNLYLISNFGKIEVQQNGDNLPFSLRSMPYCKPVFKLDLGAGETKTGYLEIKNDGEKNNLPLQILSFNEFLKKSIDDHMVLGLFYGVLLIIVLTYTFFFFATQEKSFLFYSLYVLMAGLCHFALDGLFHQYLDPYNSWVNSHAVLLFAIPATYFFGKYSEIILEIKNRNIPLHFIFRGLYRILGLTLFGVLFFPSFLKYAYPLVNILTLFGIVLIFLAVASILIQGQSLDKFYTLGVVFMFLAFSLVIFKNFGGLTHTPSIENITKIGIGMEIIALSISMANRIRYLKTNREEMQALALLKSEEMNEIKSHFLSNMSHELRTPLNAILGITQVLEKDNLDPNWKSNLDLVKEASYHLISSVNDILDFSMLENGALKLQEVEFEPLEIIQKINRMYKKQAEAKGLEFIFSALLPVNIRVLGDPMRLEQVIHNLISNAIKFTFSGAVVFRVSLEGFQDSVNGSREEAHFKFTISDTGIGIERQKLETIFFMFSQIDIQNKRRFGGFGIGLCVSKALVDLQKGSLEMESTPNLGTICTVKLSYPKLSIPDNIPNPTPEEDFDAINKHILVVEDNPMNQMVLKLMLKKWKNTQAQFASDGKEGIELLKNNAFNLVFMDLQMPVMDGYEAIQKIRRGEAGIIHQGIPVVVITADITEESKTRVMEMGINGFMTKPINQEELFHQVSLLKFKTMPIGVEPLA